MQVRSDLMVAAEPAGRAAVEWAPYRTLQHAKDQRANARYAQPTVPSQHYRR